MIHRNLRLEVESAIYAQASSLPQYKFGFRGGGAIVYPPTKGAKQTFFENRKDTEPNGATNELSPRGTITLGNSFVNKRNLRPNDTATRSGRKQSFEEELRIQN